MNILENRKKFLPLDLKIVIPTILISAIGIVTIFSTTILPTGGFGDLGIVWKQIIALILGSIIYIGITFLDLSFLKHWQVLLIIYIVTIGLLILTLLIGPTINNVKRWLVIGGLQIQASEVAKLSVIIITSALLSMKDKYNEIILLVISFILVIPIFILIYIEPNGSMSIMTLGIWFLVAFLGLSNPLRNTILLIISGAITGAFLLESITGQWLWYLLMIPGFIIAIFSFYAKNSWKILVVGASILGICFGLLTSVIWKDFLKDYQKDRIEAYFNPTETKDDTGFNVNQSRIAIGSGQLFGKGFGNGTQSKRDFLPEHQTDFIFASFAEEFGLVGSIFVILLYAVLILNCFLIGINTIENQAISLIAVGIGIQLLFSVFVNIGTNTGIIPATGVPLPLMSAGGSSVLLTLISLGVVQNISNKQNGEKKNKNNQILEVYEEM